MLLPCHCDYDVIRVQRYVVSYMYTPETLVTFPLYTIFPTTPLVYTRRYNTYFSLCAALKNSHPLSGHGKPCRARILEFYYVLAQRAGGKNSRENEIFTYIIHALPRNVERVLRKYFYEFSAHIACWGSLPALSLS